MHLPEQNAFGTVKKKWKNSLNSTLGFSEIPIINVDRFINLCGKVINLQLINYLCCLFLTIYIKHYLTHFYLNSIEIFAKTSKPLYLPRKS